MPISKPFANVDVRHVLNDRACRYYITRNTAPPTTIATTNTVRIPAPALSAVVAGVFSVVGS